MCIELVFFVIYVVEFVDCMGSDVELVEFGVGLG